MLIHVRHHRTGDVRCPLGSEQVQFLLSGLQNFTVMTDHRHFIPIINNYFLDAVENPRLQRLKEKLSPFRRT